MARLDVRTQNPERYAQVKAEQEELKIQFSMAAFGTSVARLCPYCEHKIEILYRGAHGPSRAKCECQSIFEPHASEYLSHLCE